MFTLKTLPADWTGSRRDVAEASGLSLNAGIWAKANEREKLERLAKYIWRLPLARGSR